MNVKEPTSDLREYQVPLLTVVITAFKSTVGFRYLLDSLYFQDACSFETIIITGLLREPLVAIAQPYSSRLHPRWYSLHTPNQCEAYNRGASMAQAQHLLFLDSSDILVGSRVIRELIEQIEKDQQFDLIYGMSRVISPASADLILGQEEPYKALKKAKVPSLPAATVIYKPFFSRIGKFNPAYNADYFLEFWFRAKPYEPKMEKIPKVLCEHIELSQAHYSAPRFSFPFLRLVLYHLGFFVMLYHFFHLSSRSLFLWLRGKKS